MENLQNDCAKTFQSLSWLPSVPRFWHNLSRSKLPPHILPDALQQEAGWSEHNTTFIRKQLDPQSMSTWKHLGAQQRTGFFLTSLTVMPILYGWLIMDQKTDQELLVFLLHEMLNCACWKDQIRFSIRVKELINIIELALWSTLRRVLQMIPQIFQCSRTCTLYM